MSTNLEVNPLIIVMEIASRGRDPKEGAEQEQTEVIS